MADNRIKVDLHTHSVASPDGGISAEEYFEALDSGKLNVIAITDHNTLNFALEMSRQRPTQIIAGEEIMTRQGEIIGLFLTQEVPGGLDVNEAIQLIKFQNGHVIVPHPLEKFRKGLSIETLEQVSGSLSAVEQFNGRALRPNKPQLREWAESKEMPMLASSDAHAAIDLGRTYSLFNAMPNADSFNRLAQTASTRFKAASLRGRLAPKINRFKNRRNTRQ